MTELGYCYESGKGVSRDYNEAMALYHKAADKGSSKAMGYLGSIFLYRGYIVPNDEKKAMEWNTKAAQAGDPSYLYEMGEFYAKIQSSIKAMECWTKAAEFGDTNSMRRLGHCYADGYYAKKNLEKAAEWYRKAAEAGDIDSMYYIGECYEKGKGVTRNRDLAIKWYTKAAEHNNSEAIKKLKKFGLY